MWSSSYRPRSLRPYFIPKNDNDYRAICVPTVRDRVSQGAALNALIRLGYEKTIPFTHNLQGGLGQDPRQPVSLLNAAVRARNAHSFVYKTDIKKFFDKIKRDVLIKQIELESYPKVLRDFLSVVCQTEASENIKGITRGRGVRQGMPVSPLLANIYLKSFDKKIAECGIQFARYVDDLIIFSDSLDDCYAAQKAISNSIQSLKLGLHFDTLKVGQLQNGKTHIYYPTQTATFLGADIALKEDGTYRLQVSSDAESKAKKSMMKFISPRYVVGRKYTIVDVISRIRQTRWALEHVYTENHYYGAEEYCQSLIRIEAEVIENLFVEWFKIDVHELTLAAKRFIGLNQYGQ